MTYSIHRLAVAELREAARWYRARSPTAAEAFLDAIDTAIAAIVERPEAWPRRGPSDDVHGFPLARFPFSVVYRIRQSTPQIRILAIAHARRRPTYWRSRK